MLHEPEEMYNINADRIDFTDYVFYFQDLNLKEIL